MAGLVIVSALTMVIIDDDAGTARVTARVEATQRARIALTRVMEELHSACISPEIAPVKEKSTGNLLRFVHQTGSAVQPTPVLSVDHLQQRHAQTVGLRLYQWNRSELELQRKRTASVKTLLTKVAPVRPEQPDLQLLPLLERDALHDPQTTPLSETESELTVEVQAALTADRKKRPR